MSRIVLKSSNRRDTAVRLAQAMLDIVTLCSCACIATCLWCAVAALTQSECPLKVRYVQNWADSASYQMYPPPNVSYPILISPVKYSSQNYVQSFVSSSTSSAATSTSDINTSPEKSKPRIKLKNNKKKEEEFAPELNSGQQVTAGDLVHPPTPPPRRRRRRNRLLKSILKSKFKKRESDVEDSPQNLIEKKSVKESETETSPSVHYESSRDCIRLRPVWSRFHCPRRCCRVSRSPRSPGSQINESRGCSVPKTFKDSNTSDVIFIPAYDSCNQTIFYGNQSAYIPDDQDQDQDYNYDYRNRKRSRFWRS